VLNGAHACCRYAGLLEATMVHKPHVCPITPQELLEFCREAGYSCRLEPRGTLLIPPDHNVGLTDWERSLRLRCARARRSQPQQRPPGQKAGARRAQGRAPSGQPGGAAAKPRRAGPGVWQP
jgi:hypothetical protein